MTERMSADSYTRMSLLGKQQSSSRLCTGATSLTGTFLASGACAQRCRATNIGHTQLESWRRMLDTLLSSDRVSAESVTI